MLYFREEKLRDGFSKWHVGGLPFSAVIHIIEEGDMNGLIHNHPSGMWSFVMNGSYIERRYFFSGNVWSSVDKLRQKGDSFRIEQNTIHEIIALPEGPCTTQTIPDNDKGEWGFYQFGEEILYRRHDEEHFKPLT